MTKFRLFTVNVLHARTNMDFINYGDALIK